MYQIKFAENQVWWGAGSGRHPIIKVAQNGLKQILVLVFFLKYDDIF